MLDALGVAVCLADARDPDAPLLYVNAPFEELTGWTADEALGRGLEAVLGPAAGEDERPGSAVVERPPARRLGAAVRADASRASTDRTAGSLLGGGARRRRRARAYHR